MSDIESELLTSSEDEVEIETSLCIDCDNLELETFMYTDYNQQNMVNEIDPDNNFFSNTKIDCRYCTETKFNRMINTENYINSLQQQKYVYKL